MYFEPGKGNVPGVPVFFVDEEMMKGLGYIPINCQWWPAEKEEDLMEPEKLPVIATRAIISLERYAFMRSIDALCAERDSFGLYVLKPYQRKSLASSPKGHPFEEYC